MRFVDFPDNAHGFEGLDKIRIYYNFPAILNLFLKLNSHKL